MADATFVCVAYFVASKQGKTGLADTTFDIDQIDPATSAMTTYLTAQAGTEVRNGIYRRFFTGDDAMMYEFVCKTADATVDQRWLAGVAVLLNRLERLDTDVSSRAIAGDAMALTAGERTTLAGVVWGYATRTLTSFGTLVVSIWTYVTRTLTMTAQEIADTVTTGVWTKTRGTTWEIDVTLNVDLSWMGANDELWWTLKTVPQSQTDAQAVLQISESTGLIRLNRAATTPAQQAWGSLTITDAPTGALTVYVSEQATTLLPLLRAAHWDFAVFRDGAPDRKLVVGEGTLNVIREVTRKISK